VKSIRIWRLIVQETTLSVAELPPMMRLDGRIAPAGAPGDLKALTKKERRSDAVTLSKRPFREDPRLIAG
jgi:hypothetical protein